MKIDYRDLFLTKKELISHLHAYGHDMERYIATFMLLQNSDVHIDWEVKEKVLGALLLNKNEGAIKYLFTKPFWTILDIRNVIRLLWTSDEAKRNTELRTMMKSGYRIKKPRRDMLKERIKEMQPEQIERSILRHSYNAWREVIDFLHIPERHFPDYESDPSFWDDFKLSARGANVREMDAGAAKGHSQLMKTIMDGSWEPTPFIRAMRSVNNQNAEFIISQFPTEFHYLRSKLNFKKNPQFAAAYLKKCSPANILRWYSDLWFPSTQALIEERLDAVDESYVIHYPYSVYFDLLYTQRNVMSTQLYVNLCRRADAMTGRFILPIRAPTLVAIDQSSSMTEEMVKIGTVIGSLIGQQVDAQLVYFYGSHRNAQIAEYENIPLGTDASLSLIDSHQPTGNTPMAQIMSDHLQTEKELQSLVLITDEEENDRWNGMNLLQALRTYRDMVTHNIEIMVIAVQSDDTRVSNALENNGFNVVRYRCDSLRNIESLFAMIHANTPSFAYDQFHLTKRIGQVLGNGVSTTEILVEVDEDLVKYKKVRDNIFASVIRGSCVNCSAPLTADSVTAFRYGSTIACDHCDFAMSPTLFR